MGILGQDFGLFTKTKDPIKQLIQTGTVSGPPVILSVEKLQAFVGKEFSFTATRFPDNDGVFTAVGLAAGLSINSTTGEISGSPVQEGSYQVTLIIENEFGKDTQSLEMSILILRFCQADGV